MPVAWEVTHLLISAAPESSENQKYMALGCPARTAEQETEQDVWPAAGGSLRSPSFSPWTARPLLPSHLALLMVVSFSLGPLKYGRHGLLSELGLFFVEAGWARLPKGLLMTRPAPWGPSHSSLGPLFPSGG